MSFRASLEEVIDKDRSGLLTIPPHWARVRIGDVASIQNGFAFNSKGFQEGAGFPLIRIRDIRKVSTEVGFIGGYDDQYVVQPGDLLVGMDGDFNVAMWMGRQGLLNQRVCRITPNEAYYDRRFLFYALPGYLAAINAHTSSVTVKHLSSRTVADIPLPLPNSSEQRRIVAKLDELFSELDAGVAALERAQAKLKRYRASVLKAAVEGKLTEEWRRNNPPDETGAELLQRILVERRKRWEQEQLAKFTAKGQKPTKNWKAKYREPTAPDTSGLPELPVRWCWATVDQVAASMMNGYGARSSTPAGKPRMVLRLADIRQGQISYQNPRHLDCTSQQIAKYKLSEDDVLIVRVNGSADLVGRMVDCRDTLGDVLFCDHFIRAKCMTVGLATWLRMCSETERFRSHVERTKVSSAGQHTVNQGVILPFAIPLPPEREAKAVMALIDELLSQSRLTEGAVIDGRMSASALRQSILKRGFEGRLVPQDPNDEPASVLLERIRAKQEADKKKRERRTTKPTRKRKSQSP